MKKIFSTIILSLIFLNCFSQTNGDIKRTWHWYFGDKAGLDFSSGSPVVDTNGQMSVYAGCAAISDTAGNLLMYTDGFNVWNREHNIMPNGTNLAMGNSTPFQSSIIIPKPGRDINKLFYIFHLTAHNFKDTLTRGLQYSIVDMTLDNGRGDVLVKGQMLLTPVSEALGAVYHTNCKDIWVMGHKRGTDCFYAYLLTENGIEDTVINEIGNFAGTPYGAYGLKFSPDGSRMASSAFWDIMNPPYPFDTLHLFDFDRQSGRLSNKMIIPLGMIGAYCFSPDNNKLYVHDGAYDLNNINAYGYQFDLTSNHISDILNSKILLYYDDYWNHTDFQNTTNGTIIATKGTQNILSLIEYPNNLGVSCNLIDTAFMLSSYVSLPNFVQSYFDTNPLTSCPGSLINEIQQNEDQIEIYPNPFYESANILIQGKYDDNDKFKLTLFNILGQKAEIAYTMDFTDNYINITIKNEKKLSEGMYYINIQINNISYTGKIIIAQ